jgi:ABC-type transport system involved in multi-copper enzyme maturation permease subunit
MIGRIFLMEFRLGWRGFLLFLLIVMLVAGGMPQIYPIFMESFQEDLEGADKLSISVPEDKNEDILLSWEPLEEVSGYMVIEDNRSSMTTPVIVYAGNNTAVNITYDFDEKRYYAVLALSNETSEPIFIGMTSTEKSAEDLFAEMMENPVYKSMAGGRVVSMSDIKGFISLEFFSWWILLAGLFLGYISVSNITEDFEGKRMDLIFSQPISRERYLIEKFCTTAAITTISVLWAALLMAGAVMSIGKSDELSTGIIFMALIGSIPMFLVIQAFGFLTSVQFKSSRIGIGFIFLFILIEYIFFITSGLAKQYESLQYLSIMHYWDYDGILFDEIFNFGNFIGLFVFAVILLIFSIIIFKKSDIPT